MDLWNLNFGHVTTMTVNNTESVDIVDGRNLFSKIEIANGYRASSEFAHELEQCIVDLNVHVEIRHACLRDVSVWLINKGPKLQGSSWTKSNSAEDRRILLFKGDFQASRGCGGGGLVGTIFDEEVSQ